MTQYDKKHCHGGARHAEDPRIAAVTSYVVGSHQQGILVTYLAYHPALYTQNTVMMGPDSNSCFELVSSHQQGICITYLAPPLYIGMANHNAVVL